MNRPLDVHVTLTSPPQDVPTDVIASIALGCEALGLSYSGDSLTDPLKQSERDDLRWYLEEYWLWPYEGFAQRGKEIEALLISVGKRLYNAVFGSIQAMSIVQTWISQKGWQHQISIVSDIPSILSLPWELLHDGHEFLSLNTNCPVSIVRRLPLNKQADHQTTFVPPLRILLVTSQPEGTGFVDPRGIAHELYDELQAQSEAGTIEIEFLRPPTLTTLRTRLKNRKRPIHILHFDGHGIFDPTTMKQGMLAFEDEEGKLDAVEAEVLARALQDSDVRLVVLTACQSAMSSEEDPFSSVAAQLIHYGLDAVVAMNTTVLVASTTRYAEAFYHALATGTSVAIAHEQARRALYINPHRHLQRRHQNEAGTPIQLRDWWVPHLYLQRVLSFQLTQPAQRRKKQQDVPLSFRLNQEMPNAPRYGFHGRARELLKLERWLLQGKVVVVSGFGGIGKTALAREAADWLTRTKMYDRACFVSFEHGGNATVLLSVLGQSLGISDGHYNPHKLTSALAQLAPVLKKKRTLLIADNLESVLPGGEVPLTAELQTQIWDVFLELAHMHAGILLTSRDTTFDDGRFVSNSHVALLPLRGLRPNDAYIFASHLLDDLSIDPVYAPYPQVRDFLAQLDHHPLAMQLVLPAFRTVPISTIRTDFATLLPTFVDDTETGRNRSLLASLEYSLRRLSKDQRTLLSRLAQFEGGASEDALLAITEMSEHEWTGLLPVLEQSALLTREPVHKKVPIPFLHFHPVLTLFLRNQLSTEDKALARRYTRHYYTLALRLHFEDQRTPHTVRPLARRELPNFRRAISQLLEAGQVQAASDIVSHIARFLTIFGLEYECDEIQRRVAVATSNVQKTGVLTRAEYQQERGLGESEFRKGNIAAAKAHFTRLLEYSETQTEWNEHQPYGCGSFAHCTTLHQYARCCEVSGQFVEAKDQLQKALAFIDALLSQRPDDREYLRERGVLLNDLGGTLLIQGQYVQAQQVSEEALKIVERVSDLRTQALVLAQLGMLALEQQMFAEAQSHYMKVLKLFRQLSEPAMEAVAWHQLGIVAERQKELDEAERCYRKSLEIRRLLDDGAGAADTCSQLAGIAEEAGRPLEAEAWHMQALAIDEQVHPGSYPHARHLNNLADLLLGEVQKGHMDWDRLIEVRGYAEQALAILETLDASSGIWITLSILARIADLEGMAEEARDYHRRERETFAAFEGNRYSIDHEHGFLIKALASAVENTEIRATIEAGLQPYEVKGWHITLATQRIWAGERDWHLLTEDLDRQDALLILRVLETLASSAYSQADEGPDKM